ncbi:hypothetical protein B7486_75300, partial [cyanobacterium TDX16]
EGSERALIALLDAGHPAEVAVPAYLALVDYVLGTVFFDTGRGAQWHADAVEGAGPLPPPEDERLRQMRAQGVAPPAVDHVFTFGLRAFLDGLEHRPEA